MVSVVIAQNSTMELESVGRKYVRSELGGGGPNETECFLQRWQQVQKPRSKTLSAHNQCLVGFGLRKSHLTSVLVLRLALSQENITLYVLL